MTNSTDRVNAAKKLQELNEREQNAQSQVVRLNAVYDTASSDLASLMAQAKERYGTDNIEELKTKLASLQEENTSRLNSQNAALDQAEAVIRDVFDSLEKSKINLGLELKSQFDSPSDRAEYLRDIVVRLQAEYSVATNQLSELQQQCMTQFGTFDLHQLRDTYQERREQNMKLLAEKEQQLIDIEQGINEIMKQASDNGCSIV